MSSAGPRSVHSRGDEDRGRLLISCPDRPGIVAAVSTFLAGSGANITHSDQHSTAPSGGRFFMRIEFELPGLARRGPGLESAFSRVADEFGMDWRLAYVEHRKQLAVFVSRQEHCLLELLWQWRAGDLEADIALVISNHRDLQHTVETWDVPFHYVPVDPADRESAEVCQIALLDSTVDAVVLARYMQILSPTFVSRWAERVINIHHSFLPAFVGAQPYDRAHERGVKLIGATAHYVTAELDAGPIIEQDVTRVDHRHTVADLKRMGRLIERVVLARAVAWHAEDRILVHGDRTVVFA
jgi:formyltetrahydrofolate deformylase